MTISSVFKVVVLAIAVAGVPSAHAADGNTGAHAFSFQSIDETRTIDLQSYRGKVLLVVNTASFCGFTPQYEGLQKVWQDYRDKGLVVLGVPSNDFGGQEPKAETEIAEFCRGAFNVSFPLTRKYKVKGPGAHGFYKWIDAQTKGKGSPRWNFHKLLIDQNGQLAGWFASSVRPTSAQLTNAIDKALSRPETGS